MAAAREPARPSAVERRPVTPPPTRTSLTRPRTGLPYSNLAPPAARLLGALVDLGVPVALYLLAGTGASMLRDAGNRPAVTVLLLGYLWMLGWVCWHVVAQVRTGQSVGKRLVHVRVVDATASPPGVGRTIMRLLLHLVDLLPAGLGFLWPLWDVHGQTFADKLTGTTVVRDEADGRR